MSKAAWPRKAFSGSIVTLQVLCTVHLFNEHIAEIRPCTGASMYPTLGLNGDYILHSRLLLRFVPLRPNTLVTAISPLDPSHQVLKRIAGIEGDVICVDPSGERTRDENGVRGTIMEYRTVPKGCVWLKGDNTSNSIDSRDYGMVPIGLIRGIVVGRIWPSPRWLSPPASPIPAKSI